LTGADQGLADYYQRRAPHYDKGYDRPERQDDLRTDEAGNTYQRRQLPDGTAYEIVKNFPDPAALRAVARRHGAAPDVVELDHFWLLTFRR
jgi:hypothetical protein